MLGERGVWYFRDYGMCAHGEYYGYGPWRWEEFHIGCRRFL